MPWLAPRYCLQDITSIHVNNETTTFGLFLKQAYIVFINLTLIGDKEMATPLVLTLMVPMVIGMLAAVA